jgi:hypothetical protein
LALRKTHRAAQARTVLVNRGANHMEIETTVEQQSGITIVILSYERMKGLSALLKSLSSQQLDGFDIELILFNNSPRVRLTTSWFSKIGRLLRRFNDVKVMNSSYNWRWSMRYALATVARHETVLFIDDDITLIAPDFISYMYRTFRTLRPVDILSCWNTLWVEWKDDYFSTVSMGFTTPEIDELIQTDTCGPGICMFNRETIMTPRLLQVVMRPEYVEATDMAFSLIAAIETGSRSYYLPSYGMLKFHREYKKEALTGKDGHYDARHALYKSLLKDGYRPVLSKACSRENREGPAWKAGQKLLAMKHKW